MKIGLKNIKSCDDIFFETIDKFYIDNLEDEEGYSVRKNIIDFFYAEGGKVDTELSENTLVRLQNRLDFLQRNKNFNKDLKVVCDSSVNALIMAIVYDSIVTPQNLFGGEVNGITTFIVLSLAIVMIGGIFALHISSYSMKGDNGRYTYIVYDYEINKIQDKINLYKSNNLTSEDYEILQSKYKIIELVSKAKKSRKEKNADIESLKKLQLCPNDIEYRAQTIIVASFEVVLLYKQGDKFGYDELLNDDFKEYYRIINKYFKTENV